MRLMRLKEVMDCTGLGSSSIYSYISDGQFPKPVSIRGRAVGMGGELYLSSRKALM